MARRKLKFSKSLIARLGAIGVLLGMGGFAVYQSKFVGSGGDDENVELAENSDGDSDADKDADDQEPDGDGAENQDQPKSPPAGPTSGLSPRTGPSTTLPPTNPRNLVSPSSDSSNRPSIGLAPPPRRSFDTGSGGSSSSSNSLTLPRTTPSGPTTTSSQLSQPGSTGVRTSLSGGTSSRLNDTTTGNATPGSQPPALPAIGSRGGNPASGTGLSNPGGTANPSLPNALSQSPDSRTAGTDVNQPETGRPGVGLSLDDRSGAGAVGAVAGAATGAAAGALASANPSVPDLRPSIDKPNDLRSGSTDRPSIGTDNNGVESGSVPTLPSTRTPGSVPVDTSLSSNRDGAGSDPTGSNQDDLIGRPGAAGAPTRQLNALPAGTSSRLGSSSNLTQSSGDPTSEQDRVPPRSLYTPGQNTTADSGRITPRSNYNSMGQSGGMGGYTRSSATDAAASAIPGPKNLEGPQAPSVAIEKKAPLEIQVGRTANFEIHVRNVGHVDATDVVVTDRVPAGTRLENAEPRPVSSTGGLLIWNLGTIKPGAEQIITLNLTPLEKGEIGSVAQVTFHAQAGVRTLCTQPELALDVQMPDQVLIGEDVQVRLKVTNKGDGAASNVVIEEDVPVGLSHPEGRELQYYVGTLAPGESRDLALTLKAASADVVRNTVSVRGDNNLFDEKTNVIEVVAPRISIAMVGPHKRYLERQAMHRIKIENNGTAPATNVEIVAHLPRGLQFVETNNFGTYDPNAHAVYWGLEQLPTGISDDSIQLVTLPVETGEQNIEYSCTADLNLADNQRQRVLVEELAELFFDIDDVADPIEVGSETIYHLHLTNQGSKDATMINLRVDFPVEMQPIAAEGEVATRIQGQSIFIDSIERLEPGGEMQFRIQAKGVREGDHRVEVILTSAETSRPVAKQASTQVYIDR